MSPSFLTRVRRLRWGERAALGEAVIALALAAAAIRLLPFHRVVRLSQAFAARPGDRRDPASLARAVARAAPRLPWRNVCFQQGLALHWMLRRRGIASLLHYGVRQGEGGIEAHVWVSVAGEPVIGGAEAGGFECLATYR